MRCSPAVYGVDLVVEQAGVPVASCLAECGGACLESLANSGGAVLWCLCVCVEGRVCVCVCAC